MTKRHYAQSFIILLMAYFIVRTIFQLNPFETIIIVALAIICVLHTMDVRDDIMKKVEKNREKRNGDD